MKYSLFTVSVPEMTLEEAAQKMKEYGYNGVDWRVTAIPTDPEILAEEPSYWRNNLCTVDIDKVDEIADEVGGIAQKYGLEVNALATYLESSDSLEKIEKCMIAAKKMGCSRIRVNARKMCIRDRHFKCCGSLCFRNCDFQALQGKCSRKWNCCLFLCHRVILESDLFG